MKKIFILTSVLPIIAFAQIGNVGINTEKPDARLTIQSKGNTDATKALVLRNSSNTDFFTIKDDKGYIGLGTSTPTAPVELLSTDGTDFLYEGIITNSFRPSFKHITYATAGSWSNINVGGQLFLFDQGMSGKTEMNQNPNRGLWFKPANKNTGIYISKSNNTGVSIPENTDPTVKLDIGGSIRLRETNIEIVANDDCSNRSGEIGYYKGHFYGCDTNNKWKQLDN